MTDVVIATNSAARCEITADRCWAIAISFAVTFWKPASIRTSLVRLVVPCMESLNLFTVISTVWAKNTNVQYTQHRRWNLLFNRGQLAGINWPWLGKCIGCRILECHFFLIQIDHHQTNQFTQIFATNILFESKKVISIISYENSHLAGNYPLTIFKWFDECWKQNWMNKMEAYV